MSIPIHSNKENRCKNSEIKYAKINSLGKFEVNPLTPVPAVIGRATCDPERFVLFFERKKGKKQFPASKYREGGYDCRLSAVRNSCAGRGKSM